MFIYDLNTLPLSTWIIERENWLFTAFCGPGRIPANLTKGMQQQNLQMGKILQCEREWTTIKLVILRIRHASSSMWINLWNPNPCRDDRSLCLSLSISLRMDNWVLTIALFVACRKGFAKSITMPLKKMSLSNPLIFYIGICWLILVHGIGFISHSTQVDHLMDQRVEEFSHFPMRIEN